MLVAMRKEISGPTPPLRVFGHEHAAAMAAAAAASGAAPLSGSLPHVGGSGGVASPGATPAAAAAGGGAASPGGLPPQQQWGQGPSSTGMWASGPGSTTAVNTGASISMGGSLMHGAGAGKPAPKFDPLDNSVSYMPSDSEGDMSDDD